MNPLLKFHIRQLLNYWHHLKVRIRIEIIILFVGLGERNIWILQGCNDLIFAMDNWIWRQCKLADVLGFRPKITLEESIRTMLDLIEEYGYTDFNHPRYYNITWMRLLEEVQEIIQKTGGIFDVKSQEHKA